MPFLKYFIFSFSFLAFFYSSSQTIVSYSETDGLLNNYVKCVAVEFINGSKAIIAGCSHS